MTRPLRYRGVTMLEMLTVMAIIVVIVGMIATVVGVARKRARRAEVASFVKNIESAAKTFQLNYNRWPFEVEGATLKQKLNASDVFAELSPGNAGLAPCSYQPLLNKQRVDYLAIPPQSIRGGKVVDAWGHEVELYWNPDARVLVVISPGENGRNETIDAGGQIRKASDQGDDIHNL
ncbi:MAG TPA: type II secretion system protein [Planctomycetota bacterium]|nr:type II secretion system protein [Planctomycetota bacterium]